MLTRHCIFRNTREWQFGPSPFPGKRLPMHNWPVSSAMLPNLDAYANRGLWNYSRHPNYFFEWLIWVAWAVFALGSPFGWIAIGCPLLMLYFLFRLTGIPATEAQALRSKGEAYREYQRSTSAFIPWFKRAQ